MMKTYEDLLSFGKENVAALVQSGTLATKGFEELAKAYAAIAGESVNKATAASKALVSVKSPAELVQLQAQFARESADSFLAESRKLAEIVNTVTTSAFEPLQARAKAVSGLYKATA